MLFPMQHLAMAACLAAQLAAAGRACQGKHTNHPAQSTSGSSIEPVTDELSGHESHQQWPASPGYTIVSAEALLEQLLDANRKDAASLEEDAKIIVEDLYAQWAPIFPDALLGDINDTLQEVVTDLEDGMLNLPLEKLSSEPIPDEIWSAMVDACNLSEHCLLLFNSVNDAETTLESGGVDEDDISIIARSTARSLSRLGQRQSAGRTILCVGAAITVLGGVLSFILGLSVAISATVTTAGIASPFAIIAGAKAAVAGIAAVAGGTAVIVNKCV